MADAYLPSTPADGNTLVLVVPAVADLKAIKLTEVNAATAVDISCYLTGDGYSPSLDEQVVADERLCDTETRESPGRHSRGLDLTYIDNTNAVDVANVNKAVETLVPGSGHVIIVRRGLPHTTPIASGQTVTAYRVTSGQYNELPPEANSVFKISQKQFVSGSAVRVKLAA